MTNASANTRKLTSKFDVKPILARAWKEAEQEHQKLQEVFAMMGWANLPDVLKIEIKDDVVAMVKELEGQYSTCDPYVIRRRERVSYWVDTYQNGICSLQTAIDALKVTKI